METFHVFQQRQPRNRPGRGGPDMEANLIYQRDVSAHSAEHAIRLAREWSEFKAAKGLAQFPIVQAEERVKYSDWRQ